MGSTIEFTKVRQGLDQARSQRTQITRGAPLPIDTVHVVGACPSCGTLGFTILGFPDPPYAGPQGQPRYRNAAELKRFLEEIVKNPPPLPSPEDPTTTVDKNPNPQWKGVCKCGAKIAPPVPDPRTGKLLGDPEATPRQVCGLRFLKAMPGSGAELVVEVLSNGGAVPFVKDEELSYQVLRAPLDGVESVVADSLDDAVVDKAFGRPLTLAERWRSLLSRAAHGEELLEPVENGYWLWAGPKENSTLDKTLEDRTTEDKEKGSFPLLELPHLAPMPQGPAWPQWAFEHAERLGKGELRAGVLLDRSAVRKLIETGLERAGLGWQTTPDGAVVFAVMGEVRWPVEVAIVSLGASHLGWFFSETVAAAVGEALARVTELKRFLEAARADRPDLTFTVDGMRALASRKDGSPGRPLDLMKIPFQAPPGSPDFKRELKFVCDDLPKGANPTRLCPCGERAFVAARIFPQRVVDEFGKATQGKSPRIIEQWKGAALVATISCDRHVRIPMAEEIEQTGLKGAAFDKRLAEDLPHSIFAVDVSLHEDKNKKRALLAFGPLVASVVINDHLVSALHAACKLPSNELPLRSDEVNALITTPNVLCLAEEGFDDDMLDQVLDMGAAMDGLPEGVDPPFDLSWDVKVTAQPVGRFVNLHPQPPGQGQGPGPAPNNARR
ncbi:MAG: hypothetical protein HY909_14955 [Deltaproteobacteria bacterium]|nr:hypothetical protein [Deltaproteobacteria bacterium]